MTPPESLWVQFSVIGIFILMLIVAAGALWKLWRDLLSWMEKQDAKREEERETQRKWEASQNIESDKRWQSFIRQMQEEWLRQDLRNTEVLEDVAKRLGDLTVAVNNHDTWTRAKGSHTEDK